MCGGGAVGSLSFVTRPRDQSLSHFQVLTAFGAVLRWHRQRMLRIFAPLIASGNPLPASTRHIACQCFQATQAPNSRCRSGARGAAERRPYDHIYTGTVGDTVAAIGCDRLLSSTRPGRRYRSTCYSDAGDGNSETLG